ncbi:MAG: HemK2/MTQ2 family protein methyltransferase [Promethearchaeia archaeon]
MYHPSDDSYLLLDYLKAQIKNKGFDGIPFNQVSTILDLGTGSGIIAIFLALIKKKYDDFTPEIYAADISVTAINVAQKNADLNGVKDEIHFIFSDLFQSFPKNLKHSFDIIIFNPPYLPSFKNVNAKTQKPVKNDLDWDGGPQGIEVTVKFLKSVNGYLSRDKQNLIYFISSSHADVDRLHRIISNLGYIHQVVQKMHVFFEDIFLNRIIVT